MRELKESRGERNKFGVRKNKTQVHGKGPVPTQPTTEIIRLEEIVQTEGTRKEQGNKPLSLQQSIQACVAVSARLVQSERRRANLPPSEGVPEYRGSVWFGVGTK